MHGLSYMSAFNYILRHILVYCVKALFQSWRWMENALCVFHFDLWGKLVDHQQENLIEFIQHRWQVSSKMASKTSSKMTSLKRPLVDLPRFKCLGCSTQYSGPRAASPKKTQGLFRSSPPGMKHGGSIWWYDKSPAKIAFWRKSGKTALFWFHYNN